MDFFDWFTSIRGRKREKTQKKEEKEIRERENESNTHLNDRQSKDGFFSCLSDQLRVTLILKLTTVFSFSSLSFSSLSSYIFCSISYLHYPSSSIVMSKKNGMKSECENRRETKSEWVRKWVITSEQKVEREKEREREDDGRKRKKKNGIWWWKSPRIPFIFLHFLSHFSSSFFLLILLSLPLLSLSLANVVTKCPSVAKSCQGNVKKKVWNFFLSAIENVSFLLSRMHSKKIEKNLRKNWEIQAKKQENFSKCVMSVFYCLKIQN